MRLGFDGAAGRGPHPLKRPAVKDPRLSFVPAMAALYSSGTFCGLGMLGCMSNDIAGGSEMSTGDEYRIKAAAFHARAVCQTSPRIKKQYEDLSRAYLRLAEQADRNACVYLAYEPPPPKLSDGPELK